MKKYTALIIDLEKSREYDIKTRNILQNHLVQQIESLNHLFKEYLEFDLTFSAGDEIQGLFSSMLPAVMCLRLIEILIFPGKIRAGIGFGEWSIKVEGGTSTQQDGPAYHMAREAIEEVYHMKTQRFRIKSGKENDIMANYLLNASMSLIRDQSETQNDCLLLMEFIYPFTIDEMNLPYENCIRDFAGRRNEYMELEHEESIKKINLNMLNIVETVPIKSEISEPEEVIKKNASQNIAQIQNVSRQTVDTSMKRGKTLVIRSMDYMALQYIKKYYEVGR